MAQDILDEINQDVGLNDAFFERVHNAYCTKGWRSLYDIKKKFEEVGRFDTFEYAYLNFLDRIIRESLMRLKGKEACGSM